jgi:Flp pilus assembly protein TadD
VEQVLEVDPRDGMALSARFELEQARGDREAALRTAELLAEVRDGDTSALVKAARLLQDSGRPASAAACYEAALRRSGPDPDLLGYLGTARLAAGDLDGAEQALTEVLNSRPDDPRAYFFLGNVALLRDDEAAARSWYRQALEREPKWAAPRVNLARFLYARGRFDEAAMLIRDALDRDPGNAEARELLRLVRSRNKDPS